jgi:hypothetical protein
VPAPARGLAEQDRVRPELVRAGADPVLQISSLLRDWQCTSHRAKSPVASDFETVDPNI